MRQGRSFYNPETSWFGYASYMYKWWVQTSLSHNMVVVDAKMQEPAECAPLLFHTGALMQVMAAETTARWSNPPYQPTLACHVPCSEPHGRGQPMGAGRYLLLSPLARVEPMGPAADY